MKYKVTISSSGFSKTFNSEEEGREFFGHEEWVTLVSGVHPEYILEKDEDPEGALRYYMNNIDRLIGVIGNAAKEAETSDFRDAYKWVSLELKRIRGV